MFYCILLLKLFGFFDFSLFIFVDSCSAAAAAAKLLQSCPTLCDPIDGSPPGSSLPGILQGKILEWVAISFSKSVLMFEDLGKCS